MIEVLCLFYKFCSCIAYAIFLIVYGLCRTTL